MSPFDFFVDVLVLGFIGVGSYLLQSLKSSSQKAFDKTAELIAEETVHRRTFEAELARELQKTRGIERQELRFKSYGLLWKELRPLAIYDTRVLDRKSAEELSCRLTNWYFSDLGGLFLTTHVREFYFALQDLLRTVADSPFDWGCERPLTGHKKMFAELLESRNLKRAAHLLTDSEMAPEEWRQTIEQSGKTWRDAINTLAADWNQLTAQQRFATLQQAGSILRTALVSDIESRLR